MKKVRLLAIGLVFLLCLTACVSAPVSTSAPTEAAGTTEPAPDYAALYTAAIEALNTQDTYALSMIRQKEVQAAGQTFTEEWEQDLVIGSDGVIRVSSDLLFSDTKQESEEIFAENTVYLSIGDSKYSAEMTREDFLGRYAPVALMDAANYGQITGKETAGRTTVLFSAPAAAEAWLAPADAVLVSAEGSAVLDSAGALTESTYTLCYKYGGVQITETVSFTLNTGGAATVVPEDKNDYISIESIDGPILLTRAKAHLMTSDSVSGYSSQLITSQAAGYGCELRIQADMFDPMYRFQGDYTEFYSDGSTDSYKIDEIFKDGVYTLSEDGSKPEDYTDVPKAVMDNYYKETLADPICGPETLAACTITDFGSILLLECTGNDTWADAVRADICGTFLTEPTYLDDISTKIASTVTTFYFSVDKYVGLPTSYGYEYECVHTIDGATYLLIGQLDISYNAASFSAYENITEETAPDAEGTQAPTPLFYHVTGENGQEMWLFGTIHVGDDRTGFLPQQIRDALSASVALAVECDTEGFDKKLETDEDLAAAVAEAYYYSDGSTVEDHITDSAVYEYALKLMKASGNYGYYAPYLKASLWANSIDNFYLQQGYGLCSEKGVESRLEKMAADMDIPLWEIESTLFQIQMNCGWSDPLQEMLLADFMETNGVEYAEGVQALYELWCAGDEAALTEELRDDTSELTEEELVLYEEYSKAMSRDRNAGMLEVAKQYLESGDTVFYAVGLAHLLAEDGLVHTLRAAGYTVELVSFE